MNELEIKKVKVESEVVRVNVRFRPRKGLEKRRRFYTSNALALIKEEYPKLEIGMFLKVCTARNYDKDHLEGEWIFELKKKKLFKKKKEVSRSQPKLEELLAIEPDSEVGDD